MADPGKKVKTLELVFRDLPEDASKEYLLEYFHRFGEVTRFRLVSGRAEAKPFCFVRYKEKSAEDQVLSKPHFLMGRYVQAEISRTQHWERTLKHKEIQAKIKEDLKNRADMGNKCPVFEAWEHKKYLRKDWNSTS